MLPSVVIWLALLPAGFLHCMPYQGSAFGLHHAQSSSVSPSLVPVPVTLPRLYAKGFDSRA
jgi:hypothetical protein